MTNSPLLRELPSIDRLLNHPAGLMLVQRYGHALAVDALREILDTMREQIKAGETTLPSDELLIEEARNRLEAWIAPTLQRVINATGVILHTNLGRAPLSDAALAAIQTTAAGYSTLEFDLESGERGSRSVHVEALIRRITGGSAAMVVNNNAAAVLLALSALAGPTREHPDGRGAIISRGQLIEIGGKFRIPDVMAQSGARLVEVGTTNRTYLSDYENVIGEDTALILRAHRSNFALIGFTSEPTVAELAELAQRHSLMLVDDLGSGALFDTRQFGLDPEPTVQESLEAHVDLVVFSGDKLLGGPQAGILVGETTVIDRIRNHPLARAVRADKLCLAALAATLTHYLKGEALTHIPVWRMISRPLEDVRKQADTWAVALRQAGLDCEVKDGQSTVGGGSLPGQTLATALVAIRVASPAGAASLLRANSPPVIARIQEDRLVIDPRTVLDRDQEELLAALLNLKEQGD